MKNLEFKQFEIKSIDFNQDTQEMFIGGHCAVFNTLDEPQKMMYNGQIITVRDNVLKGAFTKTLKERKGRIAFCQNHNLDDPKAKIVELKEDGEGLYLYARISDSEPTLKTKINEKIFQEFSFGFVTVKSEMIPQKDGTFVRNIFEVKMYEASVVTIARNDKALITEVKSLELIDELISQEKDETKKFKLLQLKSLQTIEPETLKIYEPKKEQIELDKLVFNN